MFVPMVNIRVMRMGMAHRRMRVRMAVWFTRRIGRIMFVLMMFVVNVAVLMFHRLVFVFVLVPFGQMEPHAQAHKGSCPEK